jgi:uncharacterized membrane protein YecN with MAPEG domain
MSLFTDMTATSAAAFYIGLLLFVMAGLKLYVGNARASRKVASGDLSNADFNRATRVQMNAVEDVPVLMVGLLALAVLGMPAWYIHAVGAGLVAVRLAHAFGLATQKPGKTSTGRLIGALGTVLTFLAIAGALVVHTVIAPLQH